MAQGELRPAVSVYRTKVVLHAQRICAGGFVLGWTPHPRSEMTDLLRAARLGHFGCASGPRASGRPSFQ